MARPHVYELAIEGAHTRSAPLRFGEAARVLAAYYQEGLLDVAAFVNGEPIAEPTASRLIRAASRILVAAETE